KIDNAEPRGMGTRRIAFPAAKDPSPSPLTLVRRILLLVFQFAFGLPDVVRGAVWSFLGIGLLQAGDLKQSFAGGIRRFVDHGAIPRQGISTPPDNCQQTPGDRRGINVSSYY